MKQTISVLGKGDFFGETVLVGEEWRNCCARAIEDCTLIRIDKETFLHLVPEGLPRRVLTKLASKLRDMVSLLGGAVIDDILYRLIYGITFLYRRDSHENHRPIDLEELSSLFRLEDRSQIEKYLNKLEALEIVRVEQNVIHVTNFPKLENLRKLFAGGGGFTLQF
ncbi:MAG: cyclic nucleotide-binding domain-containing protein [Deltaproteobacteria bacterium]